MLKHNQLRTGKVDVSGHEIDLATITVPVLVFAGNTDGIAPIGSVKALLPLLPNAREVRFEIVPGGHLGMLTGRAARRTTWVVMDEWIASHSTPDEAEKPAPERPARPTRAKKAAARKTTKTTKTARPRAAKSTARTTKKAADPSDETSTSPVQPADVAPDRGAIGSNPERRFTSRGSRSLAPKR